MPKRYIFSIIGCAAAIILVIIISVFFPFGGDTKDDSIMRAQALFSTEDDYINYIESNNIRFTDITLRIIEIQRGDNFWKIARENGINIDTLLGANPHWNNLTARLRQRIVVPSEKGVLHFITDFNEIEGLITLYGVSDNAIVIQKLPFLYRLYRDFLPKRPLAVFIKDARPTELAMTESMARKYSLREMFRSPLAGRYSSFFGGRMHPIFRQHGFHNGVDIAAPHGTLVGAACRGTVTACGWMGGYGNAVVITHPNGFKTLYGHLSRINVRYGQSVRAGKIIGKVGSTGWSTGPHLHFTMWHNGKLVNPMQVLW